MKEEEVVKLKVILITLFSLEMKVVIVEEYVHQSNDLKENR